MIKKTTFFEKQPKSFFNRLSLHEKNKKNHYVKLFLSNQRKNKAFNNFCMLHKLNQIMRF